MTTTSRGTQDISVRPVDEVSVDQVDRFRGQLLGISIGCQPGSKRFEQATRSFEDPPGEGAGGRTGGANQADGRSMAREVSCGALVASA